jgi:hypothetical protein
MDNWVSKRAEFDLTREEKLSFIYAEKKERRNTHVGGFSERLSP